MAKLTLSNIGPMSNLIINGDFNIWQRGTSFTVTTATQLYTSDRWRVNIVGWAEYTASRVTDVPTFAESGHTSNYSLQLDCTTIDATIGAGDKTTVKQIVEGYNFQSLIGKACTLSFWVKSTKTGTFCVAFQNGSANRSYVIEYTVSVADTWEKKTISITFNEPTGTWATDSTGGVYIFWSIAAGSTFQTTADAWQTGNYLATENQVNGCDSTDNNFLLAQVKLEQGQVATPWKARSYAEEFQLCQRYYQLMPSGFIDGYTLATYYVTNRVVTTPFRAAPTITAETTGTLSNVSAYNFVLVGTPSTIFDTFEHLVRANADGRCYAIGYRWHVAAEL